MSRLKIEYVAVATLAANPRNVRTHSASQLAQIAESIRMFGFTNPLLVDEGSMLIAGHGRLAAAKSIGMAEVPVIRLTGLTPEQRAALAIADNKIALNAGWDDKLLVEELRGLGDLQGVVGFSNDELMRLLKGHGGATDPDEAPPLPKTPVTRVGDLWKLGPHRLHCGDATNAAAVAYAMGELAPRLMVTDPPYGVNYDPGWRKDSALAGRVAEGRIANDDRADWRAAWSHFRGAVAYVWHSALHCVEVAASLEAAGFVLRAQVVWVKHRAVIGRGDMHWAHEPAFYASRQAEDDWQERFVPEHELIAYAVADGEAGRWEGGRKQSTVWSIENLKNDTGHGAQKPVECMRRPILNNSRAGEVVYDPFVGSGTTIIAGEMTGRTVVALDIDPAYCDVVVDRWQAFTGQTAVREAAATLAA